MEILKLENVSFETGNRESLIDISLSVSLGELIIIFGPEESGLDIICPIIAGLVNNFEGDVFYKGQDIKNLNYLEKHLYRKKIGYLQRGYGLISNMSVEDNISLPLKYHTSLSSHEIKSLVNNYIQEMNLEHCRNLRPVDLLPSESLKTAFARSIILDPDLLLLEHPLSGQCLINIMSFLNTFKKESFKKGKSVIIVTHGPGNFLNFADKVVMLYKGNIVFTGTHGDYLNSDNKYIVQYKAVSTQGPMNMQ